MLYSFMKTKRNFFKTALPLAAILILITVAFNGKALNLVNNGGFETGNLTGWQTNGFPGVGSCGSTIQEWKVGASSSSTGCSQPGNPSGSTYAVYNMADGTNGMKYRLFQNISVPVFFIGGNLAWRDTMVSSYSGSNRIFSIDFYATNGTLLGNVFSTNIPFSRTDTSWFARSFDVTTLLNAHKGETIRLEFSIFIPQTWTGAAGLGLDDVSILLDPPIISAQPANQTVVLTSNATFSVTASGATPLAYQWLFNGAGISGATNSSLTVSNAGFASAGNYSVIVTNSYGSVTSSVARLSVVATTSFSAYNSQARAIARQVDGKVVLAGYGANGTSDDTQVARYNPDGSLDTTFGTDGKVITDFTGDDGAYAVAVQADGKIVAAGNCTGVHGADFSLVRYTTNGVLDSTFGTGGKVITPFDQGGNNHDVIFGVAIQSDGKIVAVGYAYNSSGTPDIAMARFNTNGTLDASFGTGGKVTTAVGSSYDYGNAVVLQPDGKIVVGGLTRNAANDDDILLLRYLTNGILDSAFGSSGKVTTTVSSGADALYALALQPDGKIVAAGEYRTGLGSQGGLLMRFNADGSNDNTFDGDGRKGYSLSVTNDDLRGVTIQPDGKIVAVGWANSVGILGDMGVLRVNSDGSPDTTFGNNGIITIPLGVQNDRLYGVTLDASGNIFAAGLSDQPSGKADFALVKIPNLFPAAFSIPLASQTVMLNSNAVFNANAYGSQPLAYQWYFNGVAIAGGTNSSLTVSNADFASAGNYQVIVTNVYGAATSSVASLTVATLAVDMNHGTAPTQPVFSSFNIVGTPASITSNYPASTTTSSGNITFTIAGVGSALDSRDRGVPPNSGSVTYGALYEDFATANGLNFSFSGLLSNAFYTVKFYDYDGFDISTVNRQDFFTNTTGGFQPAPRSGLTPLTSLTISNNEQYVLALTVVSDATGHLSFSETAPAADGARCDGLVLSYTTPAPLLVGQVTNQTIIAGSNAVFSVPPVSGFGPFSYQWLLNGTNIAGATGSSLTVSNAGYLNQGSGYQVIVNNSYGSVTSSVAALNVIPFDPTFNGTGKAFTGVGSSDDNARAMVIQPDGKIVVAGYSTGAVNNDISLARFNVNGTLDTTFNGTGKVTNNFSDDVIYGVALQADGKILVAGYQDNDFLLCRYNTNGTLDVTFNGTGRVVTDMNGASDVGRAVAVQADGKIVMAGEVTVGGNYMCGVARFLTNGTLDTSFDTDGKTVIGAGGVANHVNSVALQSDGKIVLGGDVFNGANYDFQIARLNSNGSPDSSFNGSGRVTTSIGSDHDVGLSVAIQGDEKLILAGRYANLPGVNDWALVRYNTNGTLDATFNGSGIVRTSIGSGDDAGQSVALQADGKIIVGGYAHNGSNYDFAIARYTTNGVLDATFGGTGVLAFPIGNGDDTGSAIALEPDGKIVLAGTYFNGANNDFAVARLGISPTIVTPPLGVAVECGSSTNLSASATGYPTPSYQWQFGGTNLLNATNSSYAFTASPTTAGAYTVVAANSYGSITSSVANVTLLDTAVPLIVSAPGNQTNAADSNCQFALPDYRGGVVATDCSGSVVIGQSPAPGTLVGLGSTNITFTATDPSNNVASATITQVVVDGAAPIIVTCATNHTIALGNSTSVALPDLRGQIVATDCSSYSVSQSPAPGTLIGAGATTVTLIVYDAVGNTNTCTASVTAQATAVAIVTPPDNYTVSQGGNATFTVGVSGTPPFTYQWRLNGVDILGANSSSYSVPNADGTNAGSYTVVVCGATNCVTSAPGSLTLVGLDIHPVLHIFGPIGAAYEIDYSEDLGTPTNWLVLTNIVLSASPYLFPDPTPARQAKRFYRAVKQ